MLLCIDWNSNEVMHITMITKLKSRRVETVGLVIAKYSFHDRQMELLSKFHRPIEGDKTEQFAFCG